MSKQGSDDAYLDMAANAFKDHVPARGASPLMPKIKVPKDMTAIEQAVDAMGEIHRIKSRLEGFRSRLLGSPVNVPSEVAQADKPFGILQCLSADAEEARESVIVINALLDDLETALGASPKANKSFI